MIALCTVAVFLWIIIIIIVVNVIVLYDFGVILEVINLF